MAGSKTKAEKLLKIFWLSLAVLMLVSIALVGAGVKALAEGAEKPSKVHVGLTLIGAGLAVGLACVGAGYAIGQAGAAMIAAITEKPEVFGKAFIIIVLGEGLALYGLLIAILLWIQAQAG